MKTNMDLHWYLLNLKKTENSCNTIGFFLFNKLISHIYKIKQIIKTISFIKFDFFSKSFKDQSNVYLFNFYLRTHKKMCSINNIFYKSYIKLNTSSTQMYNCYWIINENCIYYNNIIELEVFDNLIYRNLKTVEHEVDNLHFSLKDSFYKNNKELCEVHIYYVD